MIKESMIEKILISVLIWLSASFIYIFLDNSKAVLLFATIVFLAYLFSLLKNGRYEEIADFCFRYRWALALIFFLACVFLKLSGSSIGTYNILLPTTISDSKSTLFGQPRAIRSDEWAVQTPTFFSQKYNHFGLYSDRMSISPMNMVMDYYAPVKDITAIGKPLFWGYLLFGNDVGLSWYWCGQLVLLFMLSLEMFMIILEQNRKLSVLGALMITLSPNIQWWFLPHMPVVILYAEGLFVVGFHFFTAKKVWHRALLSTASVIATVGFALSIFPSFQVPCFYIVAGLLIACLFRDRKTITFSLRKWFFVAVPVVIVLVILFHFYSTSQEAIQTVLNSVYPGQRMSVGGDKSISALFTNLSTLTLPYYDSAYLNNCEVSDYVHFAPFFVFLAPRMFFRLKKEGKSVAVCGALCGAVILVAVYMVVGIPKWLATVTLLRFCNRMNGIYGWISVIFTVYGFDILLRYPSFLKKWQKTAYPLFYAVVAFLFTEENVYSYFESALGSRGLSIIAVVVMIMGLTSVLLCAFFSQKKLLFAAMATIMFLCGATVNPIEQGTTAMTNHPLYLAVQDIIKEEPNARWLNMTDSFTLSNYLMGSGARVLDATNFYFDEGKWNIIDPNGEYIEETNRYSNQICYLTYEENSVELLWADSIRFFITPETLKELHIRYILTANDYSELLAKNGITCSYMAVQDQYYICELVY